MNRVNRGGSWNNNGQNLRSANRDRNNPTNRNNNLGFRLLRPSPLPGWISGRRTGARPEESASAFSRIRVPRPGWYRQAMEWP